MVESCAALLYAALSMRVTINLYSLCVALVVIRATVAMLDPTCDGSVFAVTGSNHLIVPCSTVLCAGGTMSRAISLLADLVVAVLWYSVDIETEVAGGIRIR